MKLSFEPFIWLLQALVTFVHVHKAPEGFCLVYVPRRPQCTTVSLQFRLTLGESDVFGHSSSPFVQFPSLCAYLRVSDASVGLLSLSGSSVCPFCASSGEYDVLELLGAH